MIPSSPVPSFVVGKALQDGGDLQKMAQQLYETVSGLTAQADNTKANATPITSPNAVISTVAGAGDSVLLPPGYVGLEIWLTNAGAQSMQVFGSGSDTINGVDTATGVAQANGVSALYRCVSLVAGVASWYRILSA